MKAILIILNCFISIVFFICVVIGLSNISGMWDDISDISSVALFITGIFGLIYELNLLNKKFL